MSGNLLILTARVISLIFSPSLMPVVAFFLLLFFSYLSYTPWPYRLYILLMVAFFTLLLPGTLIYLYRRLGGWTRRELSHRVRRIPAYVISIAGYLALLHMMERMCMPRFTLGIIVAALAVQAVCLLLSLWIKVSTHAAAAGGVIGMVAAFSHLLRFDPLLPLCFTILLCGVVCTARLLLRQHTGWELWLGTMVGILCGAGAVLCV